MSIRILLLLVALSFSTTSWSQGYYIKNYEVDLVLTANGSLEIEETIDVFFEEKRRGIIRDIPFKYKWDGKLISVKISDIEVPNYKSKKYREKGKQFIRIGSKNKYLTGDHQYIIRYTVKGGVADYGQFQELYWDIIPNDWDTRIEKYNYTVKLPSSLDLTADHYRILSGRTGSQDNSSIIQYSDGLFQGRSTQSLKAGEGVTLGVELPASYVKTALKSDKSSQSINQKEEEQRAPNYWTWLIAALGLGSLWAWINKYRNNQDSELDNITLRAYPPDNMSAAQVGVYVDHMANDRDIIALIPQWGAEGYVKMVNDGKDTEISKLKDLPKDLPIYEHTLFDALFEKGNTVMLSDLKYELSSAIYKAKTQLKDELNKSDLYDAESRGMLNSWWSIALGFLLMVAAIFTMIKFQFFVLGVVMLIMGIMLITFFFLRPKYSGEGIRVMKELRGLYRFLDQEKSNDYAQLLQTDPKYFDKIFPFAVALGLDKKFLKAFNEQTHYDPIWYAGPVTSNSHSTGLGGSQILADHFDVEEIGSVFNAVRDTGGSGGFSGGGGSVGGGFGGGGGSSW